MLKAQLTLSKMNPFFRFPLKPLSHPYAVSMPCQKWWWRWWSRVRLFDCQIENAPLNIHLATKDMSMIWSHGPMNDWDLPLTGDLVQLGLKGRIKGYFFMTSLNGNWMLTCCSMNTSDWNEQRKNHCWILQEWWLKKRMIDEKEATQCLFSAYMQEEQPLRPACLAWHNI